jgi:hypothetical protein
MAALLGISIPAYADTKPQPSPTPVDLSQFQITPRLHGAPIPCGPDARLEDDVSKLHYQWLARVLVPHLSPDKDPQHAAFIKATLDASVPRDKVHAMAHAIDTSKITDPGLLYIIGWSLPDGDPASKPLFQRSLALFPRALTRSSSPSSPPWMWMAHPRAPWAGNAGSSTTTPSAT